MSKRILVMTSHGELFDVENCRLVIALESNEKAQNLLEQQGKHALADSIIEWDEEVSLDQVIDRRKLRHG